MVNEKQTHVGCALVKYSDAQYFWLYLVCNYAYTNMETRPVYETGTASSGCSTGCHDDYKGLCKATEPIVAAP